MTIIAKAIATRKAKERIVFVLRTYLEAELEALLPAGVTLPVPDDDAYFLTSRRVDAELLARHRVACLVEVVRPSRNQRDLSAVGDVHGVEVYLPLRVRLVFAAPSSYTPQTIQGKTQTREEWIEWAASHYNGAALNAIFKRGRDNYSIADILLEADQALQDVLPEVELEVGGTIIDLELIQTATLPMQAEWT